MQVAIDSAMHTGLRILTGNRGPGPAETSSAANERTQSPSRSGASGVSKQRSYPEPGKPRRSFLDSHIHRRHTCTGSLDGGSSRFPCSKLKLDNLFLQWLSMPESQSLVLRLLEDAKNGLPLQGPVQLGAHSPSAAGHHPHHLPSAFSTSTPPLSPQKQRSPKSPTSPKKNLSSTLRHQAMGPAAIPQFHFPQGRPLSPDQQQSLGSKLEQLFGRHEAGLSVPAFKQLMVEVLELPSMLAYPLFSKLVTPGESSVPRDVVEAWLNKHHALRVDSVVQMFDILRKEGTACVQQEDLKSMMAGILLSHPGLEFLQETPEFQDRYAETVIYRMFYSLDRTMTGRLTLRDLRRGDLLEALALLDEQEDVNKILKYFSYEHFYVIYCKFWELDSDHNFLLSQEDLLRYGNHALTYRIVDRIFSQAARPFASNVAGKMGYEDFVWFILSEEDKSSDLSLEYWFRCCDLDCDGCLRSHEMLYFYEEQLHRMELMSQEPVLFEDVLCQIHDMLLPSQEGIFTLRDLKRNKHLAGTLFNILFNLNKFVAFETRDPFTIRQEREDPTLTEWDRYARTEYMRLAMEEEGDDTEEAPF